MSFSLVLISCHVNDNSKLASQTNSNNTQIAASATPITLSLGTNLNGIADWSTQLPFLDAFKSSREWITQCQKRDPGCSNSWSTDEEEKLDLDENGWVKSLPAPEDRPEYTRVATLLFRGVDRYPEGQYVVLYDGEGTIEYRFNATKDEAASTPGRDVINVTPSKGGIYLIITSTDPNKTGNYIRNIRVVEAKYENTYQSEIFNPDFIEKIKKFKALRFMDWMVTNNSQQSEWVNRPKIEDASYARKGVPVEIMVELANRLKVDPWFNLPHMATDEYITKFAEIVKDSLDPDLTIYLEYSNEVWNAQFTQFNWVAKNGSIRGEKAPYQSYGVRTAQMCDIWKGVFGEEGSRVKCVMGTQTGNPWVAGQVLNCEKWKEAPCYKHGIDALAITGYFSGKLGELEYETTIESWLDDKNIDEFEKALTQVKNGSVLDTEGSSVEDLGKTFNDYSNIAKEKGLQLLVYEGGSHIVGIGKVVHNEKLTEFFIELHRRPEFYDLYTQMLEAWKDPEGIRGLFMNFSDIGKPSKWGSWGVLEHVDQESSPRYNALMDFIDKNP
ncbi:MAG: cellulose-binding protein [Symploca sp. SIO2G7]|nr:cellulose-binding protein [Symploca sp. SIO2G7]